MSLAKLQSLLQSALAHHRAGRLADADIAYRQARTLAPRNFDALHLSGVLARQLNRLDEAITLFEKALQVSPSAVMCDLRLAQALLAAKRPLDAEKRLRHAVATKAEFHEGWDQLALCLRAQDRLPDAMSCHAKAVALKPDFAAGWVNYGVTMRLFGRLNESLACHERALAVDPAFAAARFGRAQAFQQMHRLREAIAEYDAFLAVQPHAHEARSNRLFAMLNLDELTREQVFAEHVAYGRQLAPAPTPRFHQSPEPSRRLRVGVLSPDLRAHSCAYFLEPLLRHLDREEFELFLYHDHFREDAVSARLRSRASTWRNVAGQPAAALEQVLRDDALDVVIDLAGHTGITNRLPVLARKIAPVQINYLGYPATTGVPAIEYRFTDAVADPLDEADAFATEKLVRFGPTAWAYQPPEDAPDVGPLPAAKRGAITFGCYNDLGKITDAQLQVWGRILSEVADARLRLKGRGLGDTALRAHMLERVSRAGIAAERVELLERTADTKSHLALYNDIDIALDTFPYHGTTTTCEALWMGVPVVALTGDRHIARVGTSLLAAAGHPEWAAATRDEYVRIAVALAADRERLAVIRKNLRSDLRQGPLLDHRGQAQRFGAALRNCWITWCDRVAPTVSAHVA